MQNFVAVSHAVCAYVEGPKMWGSVGALGMGAWLHT